MLHGKKRVASNYSFHRIQITIWQIRPNGGHEQTNVEDDFTTTLQWHPGICWNKQQVHIMACNKEYYFVILSFYHTEDSSESCPMNKLLTILYFVSVFLPIRLTVRDELSMSVLSTRDIRTIKTPTKPLLTVPSIEGPFIPLLSCSYLPWGSLQRWQRLQALPSWDVLTNSFK